MSQKGIYSAQRKSIALVRLLVKGYTIKEACFKLDITYNTSKEYLWRERQRYGARTTYHLIALFIKNPIQHDGDTNAD